MRHRFVVATRQLTSTNPAYETRDSIPPEPTLIWDKMFCSIRNAFHFRRAVSFLLLAMFSIPALGRDKNVLHYGAGLIVNIPFPESEVTQVVEDVAQNTIIRGTKEYTKDEYVKGAIEAKSTPVFPAWTEGGKVYYKVRQQALSPINFKNSNDVGTLAVRYVVQPQGDKNTVLRIDALFVEDFRHGVHQSDGTVESSEYRDIQDRLQAAELLKKETAAAEESKQEHLAKQKFNMGSDTVQLSTPPPMPDSSGNVQQSVASSSRPPDPVWEEQSGVSLEQHVADLRRQVERLVKQPGAPLKSAPFHTASTLKSLEPGAEVLILISTPYWYGIETHEGEHGWLRRDQLEQPK